MLSRKSLHLLIPFILFALLITGCDAGLPSRTYVWIDVPRDGLTFADLQPVNVEGHATGSDGIARIELYVDGELWRGLDDPAVEDDLAWFEIEWLPPGLGVYTLRAIAYGESGEASSYDQAVITIGEPTATPVPLISVTPKITDTPTPVPQAGPIVQFWADPETIDAGDCTDIHWQVEDAKKVVIGGEEQPLEGVLQACLCKGETYTLTVTDLDGKEEQYRINIDVVGTCEDNQAPPAPVLSSPGNGSSLSCTYLQNLAWSAVSDASGISQYQLSVQRHYGDFNWVDVPGSVFSDISSNSKTITVDCGCYFRWRVLAVDGEGNIGPWSGWWQFTVNLE